VSLSGDDENTGVHGVLATRILVLLGQLGPGSDTSPGFDIDISLGEGLFGGAFGAVLTTLTVGAVLLALFPEYTERSVETVLDDPLAEFLYGITVILGLVVFSVLLVISVVGILVVIPLLLAAILAWAVGATIVYLAIADRLVDHDRGWVRPLVVGALINGGLALTGVGSIIALCLGAIGFGAVIKRAL
jgi:hypothetical protein